MAPRDNEEDLPPDVWARLEACYESMLPTHNVWTTVHQPLRLKYLSYLLARLRRGLADGTAETAAAAAAAASGAMMPITPPPTTPPSLATTAADTTAEPTADTAAPSLAPALRRPLRILELGCGTGTPVVRTLLEDAELAPVHVVGCDMSPTQIRLARKAMGHHGEKLAAVHYLGNWVDWVESDMLRLQFEDGWESGDGDGAGFDAVIALYNLIHLPREEQAELLRRITRWLRPGGYLLANVVEAPVSSVVGEAWLHESEWDCWCGWGAEGTLDRLRENGLAVQLAQVEVDMDGNDANFFWVLAQKPHKQQHPLLSSVVDSAPTTVDYSYYYS